MLKATVQSKSKSHLSKLALMVLCSVLLTSFSTESQAQSNPKEIKKEQRKERKAKQRAEAEKRRMAALYADADFHDEEEDNAVEISLSEPLSEAKKSIPQKPKEHVAVARSSSLSTVQEIEEYAGSLMGIPYRYGGMDKKGFDCSGFSHHVFSESGVSIPRTAQAQYDSAQIIRLRKAKKGDLLFFGKNKRKITHVGIVISDPGEPLQMIHSASSGGIMATSIDQSDYWNSRLHSAGRYLDKREMRAAR